MIQRTESILFIALSCGVYFISYKQYGNIFVFYDFFKIILYVLFVFTAIYAINRAIREKWVLPKVKRLYSLFLGAALTISFFILNYLLSIENKQVILTASYHKDILFIRLDLRKDSTYKLFYANPIGGEIYRGSYNSIGDTLFVNDEQLNFYNSTSKFIKKEGEGGKKYLMIADTTKSRFGLLIDYEK